MSPPFSAVAVFWKDDLRDPGSDLENSMPSWYVSASMISDWEEPRREPTPK